MLHQLSYMTDLAFASPLSESINLIKACPLPEPETDPARDTQTRIASSIPKLVHQIWKTADIHTYSTETLHESWKTSFEAMNYTPLKGPGHVNLLFRGTKQSRTTPTSYN